MATRARHSLVDFRRWLTLAEAAQVLSAVFDERVLPSDVLRLALDGHLRLSVRFLSYAFATPHVEVSQQQLSEHDEALARWRSSINADREARLPRPPKPVTEFSRLMETSRRMTVLRSPVYDLVMERAAIIVVQDQYQELVGGPPATEVHFGGIRVQDEDGGQYVLLECRATLNGEPGEYTPAQSLPWDSELVVRPEAIRELATRARSESADDRIDPRRLVTLHLMIGAYAKKAKLDLSDPRAAATKTSDWISENYKTRSVNSLAENIEQVLTTLEDQTLR